MNRKQLLLLLAVLLIIGAAGLVLVNRHKESWTVPDARMGEKVLPSFRLNDVTAVRIRQGAAELNLVRQNDVWRVRERMDYPANFHLLSDLLIKVRDLKVVQSEPVAPTELAQVNLEDPGSGAGGGTLVDFVDAQGKVMDALILGKPHLRENGPMLKIGSADGRWMLVKDDPNNALLVSEPLSGFVARPEYWVSKDFIKVERPKMISFVAPEASNSWTATRETESAPWILLDAKPGETLDTNHVATVARMLNYYTFMDVLPPRKDMGQTKTVKIETFDHFTYTLTIGDKVQGDVYQVTVKVDADIPKDEQNETSRKLLEKLKQEEACQAWVYTVSLGIVDPLTRDRSKMMAHEIETSASTALNPAQ